MILNLSHDCFGSKVDGAKVSLTLPFGCYLSIWHYLTLSLSHSLSCTLRVPRSYLHHPYSISPVSTSLQQVFHSILALGRPCWTSPVHPAFSAPCFVFLLVWSWTANLSNALQSTFSRPTLFIDKLSLLYITSRWSQGKSNILMISLWLSLSPFLLRHM